MMGSLRARLVLSHLVVLLTGMLIAGLLAWLTVERLYLASQAENLLAQARLVAAALQEAPLPLQASEAYSQITNMQPGIHTRLLTEGGGVAFSLPLLPGGAGLPAPAAEQAALVSPQELLERVEIQQALQGQASTAVRRVAAGGGGRVLYAAAPLVDVDGELIGIVYLAEPLPAGGLPAGVLLQLAGSAFGATLLAGLVGLLLARRLARPLEDLSQAATAIGGGELGRRLPVSAQIEELDNLGRSFNAMAADLERSQRAREAFLADVTHELRTPLTVIQGTIETLQDGALDDRRGRGPLLEGMQREAARLVRLVNDLLVLTRADAGGLRLDLQPVDVAALARQCCVRLGGLAARGGLELRLVDEASGSGPVTVQADPDRLAQVFDNLLDNAIRYAPPATAITVTVRRDGARVAVTVADRGPGIPEEHLPLVFERFYRVETARDRRTGGSGLGLAIVRSLLTAQGGEVHAGSAPGGGTEMTFWMPVYTLPSD